MEQNSILKPRGTVTLADVEREACGGAELVVHPMCDDGRHLAPHTTGKAIRKALAELNKAGAAIPTMT